MSAELLAEALHRGLTALPEPIARSDAEASLLAYLELLRLWNRTYNLTAVKDPLEMISRHVLDSLAVLPWIRGGALLDAGTGAGLPGIPLAIARPQLEVTLVDSAGKKIRFLNQVRRQLGLANVFPVQTRLEVLQATVPPDIIISRAFASLAAFATAARHLAGQSTRLLAMKGRYPEGELKALPDWVRVDSTEKLVVPGLQEDRHLVIMALIP